MRAAWFRSHPMRRYAVITMISAGSVLSIIFAVRWTADLITQDQHLNITQGFKGIPTAVSTGSIANQSEAQRVRAEARRLDREFMAARRDRLERQYFASKTDRRDARNHWQNRIETTQRQFDEAVQQWRDQSDEGPQSEDGSLRDSPALAGSRAVDPLSELRDQSLKQLEEDAPEAY